ncbi:MAG: ABC transporter ATP-binding protein [Thermoanaerobaculia bacterium]
MRPLLEVRGLRKSFVWKHPFHGGRRRRLLAVAGVDLDVHRGECLALVGESGSGKSTLARCLVRLLEPEGGSVRFDGEDLLGLSRSQLNRRRKRFQMVFQDVAGAFDPRLRIAGILAEPLRVHRIVAKAEIPSRMRSLLAKVGLDTSLLDRYPHQLSGGQRQRLNIARALATEPDLLILDEPVSALDMSVRARLLLLLAELQRKLDLTLVLIAHDLAMTEQIADRVAVLYLGRLVELGSRAQVFGAPMHPYTASLLAAVPDPSALTAGSLAARRGRRRSLAGEQPSAWAPPEGCAFHPRCPVARRLDEAARRRCCTDRPALVTAAGLQAAACHYPSVAGATRMDL